MSISYKCRKCRGFLYENVPEIPSEFDPQDFENGITKTCCNTWEHVNCLQPLLQNQTYPQWMEDDLLRGNWVRGKLNCPNCKTKVGAFDFVKGSKCSCKSNLLPEVYILMSKVDLILPKKAQDSEISRPRRVSQELPVVSQIQSPDFISSSTLEHFRKLEIENAEISPEEIVGNDEYYCMRMNCDDECGVCLELLLHPQQCKPCGHIFCDICLRCLTRHSKSQIMIPCPLCRKVIESTQQLPDLTAHLKRLYPAEYRTRIENSTPINSPLPHFSYFRFYSILITRSPIVPISILVLVTLILATLVVEFGYIMKSDTELSIFLWQIIDDISCVWHYSFVWCVSVVCVEMCVLILLYKYVYLNNIIY